MLSSDGDPVLADFSLAKMLRDGAAAPPHSAPQKPATKKAAKPERKRRRDEAEAAPERQQCAAPRHAPQFAPTLRAALCRPPIRAARWPTRANCCCPLRRQHRRRGHAHVHGTRGGGGRGGVRVGRRRVVDGRRLL
eukprot:6209127-Prymnesium_polylepis.2